MGQLPQPRKTFLFADGFVDVVEDALCNAQGTLNLMFIVLDFGIMQYLGVDAESYNEAERYATRTCLIKSGYFVIRCTNKDDARNESVTLKYEYVCLTGNQ